MSGRRACWVLAALVGAAAVLRFWHLGSESLWVDEAYTLSVAREGAWQVLLHHDNTPPLHALLLHFWISVAGTSEWALRFPSALFGTAAVALTFPVARRIAGAQAALVATGLHAGSFYLWSVSQEARTYSLYILLTLASFHFFLRLAERWSRRDAWLYVAASVLMLYSHVLGLLSLAAQGLYVAFFRSPAPWPSRRWLAVQGAIALGFLPWLPVFLAQAQGAAQDFWRGPAGAMGLLSTAAWLAGSKWLAPVVGSLLLGAIAWFRPWRRPLVGEPAAERWRLLWLALLWLVVPVAVLFAAGLVAHVFKPKYLLASAVPLYILAAQAFVLIRPGWAQAGIGALAVALMVITPVAYATGQDPTLHRDDWRAATHELDARAHRGDLVVFNGGVCDATGQDRLCPYHYYANRSDLRLLPLPATGLPVTPADAAQLAAHVANESRLWLFQGFYPDGQELIPKGLAGAFSVAYDHQFNGIRLREFVRAG